MTDLENKDLYSDLEILLKDRRTIIKYEKYAGQILFKRTKGDFARQYTASDIVANILAKLVTGSYNWNRQYPFDTFMYLRIKTEVFNIVKHERHFIPISVDVFLENLDDNIDEEESGVHLTIAEELVQEPDFINPDNDDDEELGLTELMEIAYQLFSDMPDEFCVVDEIFKNKRPREIAEELGISRQEVRNIAMRIKRALIIWGKKNKHKRLLRKLLRPVKKNKRRDNHLGRKEEESKE
jgi:DNA-directed RNA polymerase specialized sigma24 family protein